MKKTFILLSIVGSMLTAATSFGQIVVQGLNPAPVQGFYNFTNPDWGADLSDTANAVQGFGVFVDDGTTGDSLGCNALVNGAAVTGKIAFIYRGTCEFGAKALKAQNAGAIAAVIINNVSGTMAMGAGADGANVTIPVVMISMEDGQLLRQYINAGTLEMFIGSKFGQFANDLGMQANDVIRPLSTATPKQMASGDYIVHVGANVRNFGNQAQANVTLTAKILLNGTTEVYNETSSVASVPPGDSTFIVLDDFSLPNANVAKYTLTYTASATAADQENSDNVISQDFYITEGSYAKARYDLANDLPTRTGNYKPASSTQLKWGIIMNTEPGSNVKATGVKFATSTATTDSLTGEVLSAYVYEWDDANADGGITDDELTELSVGFYSYTSNLQNEFVTIPFDDEPTLADDAVYYVAVEYTGNKDVFFAADEGLDYEQTINYYEQSINPLYDISGAAWYGGGFGSDLTLALLVNTSDADASIEENNTNVNLSVYPNPASDVVNIRFGNAVSNADVKVEVVDVTGRTVMNKLFNLGTSQNFVTMNTSDLANGSYFFKVSMNGAVVKSIPVVVSK